MNPGMSLQQQKETEQQQPAVLSSPTDNQEGEYYHHLSAILQCLPLVISGIHCFLQSNLRLINAKTLYQSWDHYSSKM